MNIFKYAKSLKSLKHCFAYFALLEFSLLIIIKIADVSRNTFI